jgi:hypothetical protein
MASNCRRTASAPISRPAVVAGALDDATMMRGDRGINQIAAQPPQPRRGTILVHASEPAVADDIGNQGTKNRTVNVVATLGT